MFSGALADRLGYHRFFIVVMVLCLVTFLVAALVKIDPEFGKAKDTKD
jgi:PAT family beta-lactamase induction signal transducer AmpG